MLAQLAVHVTRRRAGCSKGKLSPATAELLRGFDDRLRGPQRKDDLLLRATMPGLRPTAAK